MNQPDKIEQIFEKPKPIIGMVHLLPLPGTPYYRGSMNEIIDSALSDANCLYKGDVDGILIQNRGDLAYSIDTSDPAIVSAVTQVVSKVISEISKPVGVHLLRNDVIGSMAISKVCGAQFVRVAVAIGMSYLPQGIAQGKPSQILFERARLQAENLIFLTDVDSFHYKPVVPTPIDQIISNLVELQLADAVLVALPKVEDAICRIEKIKQSYSELKVLIGGYADENNLINLLSKADGAIIGAAFQEKGRNSRLCLEKVLRIMDKVHAFRNSL